MIDKKGIQEADYYFPYHWIQYEDERVQSVFNNYRGKFLYTAYINEVIQNIKEIKADSILDVGCGDGRLLSALYERYTKENIPTPQLTGCDISERAIAFARAFSPNINWIAGDLSEIKDTYDVIVCTEVLEHIPDSEVGEFLNNLEKILNINGTIIFTLPTICTPVSAKHYRHYTFELFQNQIKFAGNLNVIKYICIGKNTRIYRYYKRIFNNNKSFIRIKFLESIFWKYYNKYCLHGNDPKKFLDMVVMVERVENHKSFICEDIRK